MMNTYDIIMQAMEDVIQLCLAYAIIFATMNTLLWINCRQDVKEHKEALKKQIEYEAKLEKDPKTAGEKPPKVPEKLGGTCGMATKNMFGSMTCEGWSRLYWGMGTGAAVVMIVCAIVSALQLFPPAAVFVGVPCKIANAITSWCPFPPLPSFDNEFPFIHLGALQIFIQGICLTGFAASVVDAINAGNNVSTANILNCGLCSYYSYIIIEILYRNFSPLVTGV